MAGARISRRRFIAAGAGAAATAAGLGALPRRTAAQGNGITTFTSPPLSKYVAPLPIPERRAAGIALPATPGTHQFHPSLPLDSVWGYADHGYQGPVLEAARDEPVSFAIANQLGPHIFASDIDTSVHGASALDRTSPREVVHLHGGLTPPAYDGHPLDTRRPGGTHAVRWPNRQQATALWYHDHAMGITRLNVYAGLSGLYLLRDDYDTGADANPLGLPAVEYEVPLILQDKMFTSDGHLNVRTSTYVPQGSWEGGEAGDTAVVNGAVWPELAVARTLYRFRLLNASNLRRFELAFANGMSFWVIGTDQGLMDAPQRVSSVQLAASERLDVLVDFTGLAPGETVVMTNSARLPFQFQIFGDPEIHEIMRFRATATRVRRRRRVPARLRGGHRQPPRLVPWGRPSVVRDMTVNQLVEATRFPPALMNLNNLPFDTDQVQISRPGAVEQWNLINTTTDDHPIHIHIANLRVIGRQPYDLATYMVANRRPPFVGLEWSPSADRFATAPMQGAFAWELGDKDSVYAPNGMITRILVRFPTEAEMGFDSDALFPIPSTVAAGAPGIDQPDGTTLECHLGAAVQPDPGHARGYVWHCHVVDHEDHEMMLPLRIGRA